MVEELFFDGVAAEPGDGAQPPGDGRPGAAAGFQVTGEALDARAAGGDSRIWCCWHQDAYLAQIQLVGLPGQADVARQEPG